MWHTLSCIWGRRVHNASNLGTDKKAIKWPVIQWVGIKMHKTNIILFKKDFSANELNYWPWTALILEENISGPIGEFKFLYYFYHLLIGNISKEKFTSFILNLFLLLTRLCFLRAKNSFNFTVLISCLQDPFSQWVTPASIRHLSKLFTDLWCLVQYCSTFHSSCMKCFCHFSPLPFLSF